jgi:hypothetical protein
MKSGDVPARGVDDLRRDPDRLPAVVETPVQTTLPPATGWTRFVLMVTAPAVVDRARKPRYRHRNSLGHRVAPPAENQRANERPGR